MVLFHTAILAPCLQPYDNLKKKPMKIKWRPWHSNTWISISFCLFCNGLVTMYVSNRTQYCVTLLARNVLFSANFYQQSISPFWLACGKLFSPSVKPFSVISGFTDEEPFKQQNFMFPLILLSNCQLKPARPLQRAKNTCPFSCQSYWPLNLRELCKKKKEATK